MQRKVGMNMNYETLKAMEEQHVTHTYNRFPIDIEHGKGASCWDASGKHYIDFTSGIGVNALGHCYQPWSDAISQQANKLGHTSNLFYTEPQIMLAKKLCDITGCQSVFFANSGAEANEAAIKAARKYGKTNKGDDCFEIIGLHSAFHGRTFGALAATPQEIYQGPFKPMLEGFAFAEANNFAALLDVVTEKTCAIIIEMIQGEGGLNNLKYEYVQQLATLCKEQDILLIVDEVQTGCGRTGTFYAYEQFDIIPDIVTSAKGLAGGLPIGATLFFEKTATVLTPGTHATTFGGGPIVCAAANLVVDTIREPAFLEAVQSKRHDIEQRILAMPHVEQISGLGLMIGITFSDAVVLGDVVTECLANGLLVLTAKTKMRLLPSLNITAEEIDAGLTILGDVLARYNAEHKSSVL